MMSRYLPAASNLNTKQCKVHFHRNRKDSQISQSGQPVKSVNAHVSNHHNYCTNCIVGYCNENDFFAQDCFQNWNIWKCIL